MIIMRAGTPRMRTGRMKEVAMIRSQSRSKTLTHIGFTPFDVKAFFHCHMVVVNSKLNSVHFLDCRRLGTFFRTVILGLFLACARSFVAHELG